MTEVGFYHLQTTPLERALPRLLAKAHEAGMRALVLAGSDERIEALDAALWTFDQGSFLPHGSARDGSAEDQPIYLTTAEENPNGATLLVLVDGMEPAFLDGFARCLDLFDGNDAEAVAAARARWTRLKEAGHDLTYWQQTQSGGWERKG
ncbi:MAG: DNA polymerase III subunit chi [Alphaproteobacteria bacterium]